MQTTFVDGSEAYNELVSTLDSIELANYIAGSNRLKAKDLKRDDEGRVIVNIIKPHILEDTDYFRKAAIHFEKHKCYTFLYPSGDPSSPYKKHWDEEKKRCINGYTRKSDGEWIPGYYYYYLNYCPILRSRIIGKRTSKGNVEAERVSGFPDFWDGDYMFFHYIDQAQKSGEYGSCLKARGKGFSLKGASMLVRNYELFGESVSYALASDTEYLDTDGLLNKAWSYLNFANKHIGFAKKLRLKDTMMEKKAGYKKPGDPTEYGFLSGIIGVTLKNTPGKARGKRGKLILWEESGIFPNLLKSWRIAQKSIEDGNRVFGVMIAFGTGGEKGSNFEGLEALFYSPEAYRIKPLKNVFDRNVSNQICGFFFPEYLNRADCYDADGNSNVIKALEEVITTRLKIKYSGTSSEDAAQAKAEEPLTPQEAVMRTSGSEFPVEELKERLAEIGPMEASFTASHYCGDLLLTGLNIVEFRPRPDKTPIREWPIKRPDLEGVVEIIALPKKTGDKVEFGRYIGGVDTVDDEYGTSLFDIRILDTYTDTLVAWWIGRFRRAEDNFAQAAKIALLYNAQLNYENKLKGFYAYMVNKSLTHLLCDTPSILFDKSMIKQRNVYGNKSKGTPPTTLINAWGRRLQADWMLTKNEFYNDLNYKVIRDIGWIRECISWHIGGNFDRVSSSNMLFVFREERIKHIKVLKDNRNLEDPFSSDPFFQQEGVASKSIFNSVDFANIII